MDEASCWEQSLTILYEKNKKCLVCGQTLSGISKTAFMSQLYAYYTSKTSRMIYRYKMCIYYLTGSEEILK